MEENSNYVVVYLFKNISRENLDKLVKEIEENVGITPIKVDKSS
ncbi:hypothetical protein [uncultured Sanguibacteroides sp.]|nr:hypothetical protein [uncultured Sanguibacteroides sp.]